MIDFQNYMTRAERVERLLMDQRTAYEADQGRGFPDHWVDLVQRIAVACQCSELRIREDCRDALEDTVKDDVALGIKIGQKMKPDHRCFSATVTDSDDRDLHFFFVARSEDEIVERLLSVFRKDVTP